MCYFLVEEWRVDAQGQKEKEKLMDEAAEVLVHFRLTGELAEAYRKLCQEEERRPHQMAKYLIRQELKRRMSTIAIADSHIEYDDVQTWKTSFLRDLETLKLDAYVSMRLCFGLYDIEKEVDDGQRRLFAPNGRFLSFRQWCHYIATREGWVALDYIRQMGTTSLLRLLRAIIKKYV
jgi:hypothetical protein